MADVNLRWIGTQLVAMQNDMRILRNDVRLLREDVVVTNATLHRLEAKQDVMLEEMRALYPQINQMMRERVDELERS